MKTPDQQLINQVRELSKNNSIWANVDGDIRSQILKLLAQRIHEERASWLSANKQDIESVSGETSAFMSRLKLTDDKIDSVIKGLNQLAKMPDPLFKSTLKRELDSDLILERISVPLGTVAFIFESRPDVLPQLLGLSIKSGNSCIVKGGKESLNSNKFLKKIVDDINSQMKLPNWMLLLETRAEVHDILSMNEYIQMIVPRGSNSFVSSIMNESKIPVLGHADGVCHLYVHSYKDLKKAVDLAIDAKIQYASACNAIETLLVDKNIASEFLTEFEKLSAGRIEFRACQKSQQILKVSIKAQDSDWGTEFGAPILAIKIVENLDEAIAHIQEFGSSHTEAILSKDRNTLEKFLKTVDAACVFANASTRFADGFRFGFGAEVGVSTSRLHARGPVGIEGLLTYKYQLKGDLQKVSDYEGSGGTKPYTHKDIL